MEQEINHMNYPRCDDLKEADAVGYVAIEPNKLIKYAFKLPDLSPNEVRINVTYTGLCHSDVHTVNGEWGACPYPICPGHEIVGAIAEVGSEVTDFKVGDKVGFGPQRDCCGECEPCKMGIENCCIGDVLQMYTYADMYWGGYATVLQQPAAFTFKLPEGIKEELAPPLLCAGVTTYAPLARHCKAGDKVGVIGVGGLGHLAVQYAKALGCEVTAFSSSKDKEAMIRELGADRVLNSTDMKVVNGEFCKFKVVINTLPVFDEKLFEAYLGTVLPNGHFVQVGLPPTEKPLSVPTFGLVGRQINITGSSIGNRKEMNEMLEFSVKHNVYPKCELFEFDEFPKAFDKLVNGRPVFRCVVKCKDYFKK